MLLAIRHYLACHLSCYCEGCKRGLGITMYLQLCYWAQKAARRLGDWAYRMEMRIY